MHSKKKEPEQHKKRGSLVDYSIYIGLTAFCCVLVPFLKTTFEFNVTIRDLFKKEFETA